MKNIIILGIILTIIALPVVIFFIKTVIRYRRGVIQFNEEYERIQKLKEDYGFKNF